MPVGSGGERRACSPAMRDIVSTTPRYCGWRPPERTAFRRLVRRSAISTASAVAGRAVVHGGVGDLHAGEVRDLGLELEQVLQRALRNLRLVGRVGGQELRALDQVIDGRRDVMAIGAGADEERHRAGGDVLRRHARRERARPRSRSSSSAGRAGVAAACRPGCRRTDRRYPPRRCGRASRRGRRRYWGGSAWDQPSVRAGVRNRNKRAQARRQTQTDRAMRTRSVNESIRRPRNGAGGVASACVLRKESTSFSACSRA